MVVYGYEGDLHSDLVAEILEHCIVKILGVVHCNVLWDVEAADYVWPEEFFYCSGAYICDRLRLNPFHKVLDRHNGEGVVSLH
jgi:hypothetical protein